MSDEPAHDELIRLLEEAKWEEITPKLLGFATFCLSHHHLSIGPNGEMAHLIVVKAVMELLEEKHPHLQGSLFRRLCVIILRIVRYDAAGAA